MQTGTVVRVPLQGRRVRGWVVAVDDEAATERRLLPVAKVSSIGPPGDVVSLASWASWRWAGPVTRFLSTASPPVTVSGLPPGGRGGSAAAAAGDVEGGASVVVERVAPARDWFGVVEKAVVLGDSLVLVPSISEAHVLAARLRRSGREVALMPRDWARAAAGGGCVVVGSRAAAWAPVPSLSAAVVVDEHDEAYQEERAPTWNARDVVIERARRAGVRCTLVSPCPSLAALAVADAVIDRGRQEERGGWPVLEVVDRRADQPGRGLYSDRLVDLVRAAAPGERVVCVLNRKGRAVLLACAACGELARCEVCDGPLESPGGAVLRCRRCGAEQPAVCRWCGSARFKALRVGVTRVREELELLAGRPVAEVTGDAAAAPSSVPAASVIVGTEAVLHRVGGAHAVAFLDFDQELLAPRYRAGEQALALLARAGRLVGGRDEGRGGRVLVQTRLPGHEVLDAARYGDASRFAVVEAARRAALRLPPETALGRLSGPGATEVAEAIRRAAGVEVLGPSGDRWLVRAGDHRVLCDALAAAPRPATRVRVEVDPLRA